MSEARTAGVRLRAGVFSRWSLASLALCVVLAGCSSANLPTLTDAPAAPPPEKQRLLSASEQREHLRILAAYGGVYREARLQDMVEKTVDKLVAASERPEQKYEVTILNSPAINAFALPNGEL
jgi:predicted Zn-dependent protease